MIQKNKLSNYAMVGAGIGLIIGLVATQIIFSMITTGIANEQVELVTSFLDDRKAVTNPYLVAMRVEDLEMQGRLSCTQFANKNDPTAYIDLSYKSQCSSSFSGSFLEHFLFMKSTRLQADIRASDGELWTLNTLSMSSKYLQMGFWVCRFIVIFMILFGYFFFRQILQMWLRQREIENKHSEAMVQLSAQVSHDIRSPLSAANMVLKQLQNVPEQQRLILRNSINRINDIANTLLQKSKDSKKTNDVEVSKIASDDNFKLQVELLPVLVDNLVSEKRVQFRDKIGLEIESDIQESYGAFVKVDPAELQRVLSNTINNAVESFSNNKGKIVVSVKKLTSEVLLKISDNGKGIPKHILEKLGQRGVTHGKEGTESGSGLGIFHAKRTIENFGGKFEIQSQEGIGSNIIITIPKVAAPKWFVEKIILNSKSQVVSLDDDLSIHSVWQQCFDSSELKLQGIEHLTFTSGTEFKAWCQSQAKEEQHSRSMPLPLFLVDYELLNQNMTGLDIVAELGIGGQSILVTSRYEELRIREQCEKLGVRLIPKGMASFVPIEIEKPKELYDLVLIDDDTTLIHSVWHSVAKMKAKKILTFATAEEFISIAASIDLKTPIYIDISLGNGVKGQDVANEVNKIGFREIHIATGYELDSVEKPECVRSVKGKDFPL